MDFIDESDSDNNESGAFDYERQRREADELLLQDPGYLEWMERAANRALARQQQQEYFNASLHRH